MPEAIVKDGKTTKKTKLQAFRFDGARTVKIVCQLDVCSGPCNLQMCSISGGDKESFGRKRRDVEQDNHISAIDETEIVETKRYKIPRTSKAVASIVIVDSLQDTKLTIIIKLLIRFKWKGNMQLKQFLERKLL